MSFDPYREWLHLPPGPRPPDPETLLGLQAGEMDRDRIFAAAMKCAGIVRGYGLSKHSEAAAELLREIAQAVQTLESRSAAHAAAQPHAPAPVDDLIGPVLDTTSAEAAAETARLSVGAETVRRPKPSVPSAGQSLVPPVPAPKRQPSPPGRPQPVTSMEDILAMLGGTVLLEPAKPIPSMSGERQRQRQHEEKREFLNTVVAVSVTVAGLLLMALLLWAMLSRKDPSPAVAIDQPKNAPAADDEAKSTSATPSAAAVSRDHPQGAGSPVPAAAPDPPGTEGDRSSPAVSSPAASEPSERRDGMPAQPVSNREVHDLPSPASAKPAVPEIPAGALAGLYSAVDLPVIGDSALSRARARPISLGVIGPEVAQHLEFTVLGSQGSLSDTCLAGVPFVVERTPLDGSAGDAAADGPSWGVFLRGNAHQYERFPDKPIKDAYVRFDRRVATIWCEDEELRFDWDAALTPYVLEWWNGDVIVTSSHGIEDSLRLCRLQIRAGHQSHAVALLRPQRLPPLRIDPLKDETVVPLGFTTASRMPGSVDAIVHFLDVTGVKLDHSIDVKDGAIVPFGTTLTFRQLTSDKIQADLPLQATFTLRAQRSKTGGLSLACRTLSPASAEYQAVQGNRRRNVIERQYLRFAATVQAQAKIHYRVFLNLQTHLVQLGTTEGVP